MTTVAYDGKVMAADTLATDAWGMREKATKIWHTRNLLIGSSGEGGQVERWLRSLPDDITAKRLVEEGYAPYNRTDNDPGLLVVCRQSGSIYRHAAGSFLSIHRPYHAIGSGRDYAVMAMRLGKGAKEAVRLAAEFDNNTSVEAGMTVLRR